MKQLIEAWRALVQEPDVMAVVILVLVLGIGAGLNLHAGPEVALSVTCDEPGLSAGSVELGVLEFSGFDFPPEIEVEFGDPELDVGPI